MRVFSCQYHTTTTISRMMSGWWSSSSSSSRKRKRLNPDAVREKNLGKASKAELVAVFRTLQELAGDKPIGPKELHESGAHKYYVDNTCVEEKDSCFPECQWCGDMDCGRENCEFDDDLETVCIACAKQMSRAVARFEKRRSKEPDTYTEEEAEKDSCFAEKCDWCYDKECERGNYVIDDDLGTLCIDCIKRMARVVNRFEKRRKGFVY